MKIKTNSKKVKKGDIFIALKGVNHDGHDYIEEAILNGASKIIAEKGSYPISYEIVEDTTKYLQDYLKKEYYDEIKDIKLIGITGTNGKTTTAFLLYEALQNLGIKASYIGTIGFYIEEKEKDLKNTTPDLVELYNLILESKEKGCKYVIMEVSSHALSYERVEGLLFDYAIYTNLTQDHLDYHKTMENYAKEKQKLFYKIKKTGKAIINGDDSYKDYFLLKENKNITYGFKDQNDYQIDLNEMTQNESIFTVKHNKEKEIYESSLIGNYNLYNITAALIVLKEEGVNISKEIVKNLHPPLGRMDKIRYNENTIIVDYAHTPDAVEKILKCVKEISKGDIFTIVGCGGNRDKEKRPLMAHMALRYSDYVIFTSDNPRNEDPLFILKDMTKDLKENFYEVIPDREKAIQMGVQKLKKSDILLILGKGHENYQIINEEKIHFDDKEIVMKYI